MEILKKGQITENMLLTWFKCIGDLQLIRYYALYLTNYDVVHLVDELEKTMKIVYIPDSEKF